MTEVYFFVKRVGLDAEGEVYVLLVAGVGVEVVGGAAVELVALAEFAADEEAESDRTEAGGDPAYGLDKGGLFFAFFVLFGAREGEDTGGVFGCVIVAGCGAEHHSLDDSSGLLEFRETVVLV
jgi:hypothetical protein